MHVHQPCFLLYLYSNRHRFKPVPVKLPEFREAAALRKGFRLVKRTAYRRGECASELTVILPPMAFRCRSSSGAG